MRGLVLKILRGKYPQIPSEYSQELRDLISEIFIKDPNKRPSISKLLEMPFLQSRISSLLSETTSGINFKELRDEEEVKSTIDISEQEEHHDSSRTTEDASRPKSSLGRKSAIKNKGKKESYKSYIKHKLTKKLGKKADKFKQIPKPKGEDRGEETSEQRTIQKFLMDLPGVQADDSESYRIEALRVYLESNLGETTFVAAYKHYINVSEINEEVETEIMGILGEDKIKFFPLIYQLIVCEDAFYASG